MMKHCCFLCSLSMHCKKKAKKGKSRHTVEEQERIDKYKNKDGALDWKRILPLHFHDQSVKRTLICDEAAPPLLMYCLSIAEPVVAEFLNEAKLHIDVLTHAGRQAREDHGLDPVPISKGRGTKKFAANCTPVLSETGRDQVQEYPVCNVGPRRSRKLASIMEYVLRQHTGKNVSQIVTFVYVAFRILIRFSCS